MANVTGTTNVPQPTFTANGFVAPSPQAVLAGVILDIQAAFNNSLNLSIDDTASLTTPQGQLAMSMAAAISNVYALFCLYAQLVDPAYAFGRMQDAIARIYDLERNPAEPTVLQVECSGLTDIIITVGALVIDPSNNIYSCTGAGTIAANGLVTLSFACISPGPVPVPSSVKIYQGITGWDSATLISGVEGENTESRQAFEARREDSVAGNSMGAIGSIIGVVSKVPGVIDYYGYNNNTAAPITIGGVTIAANSIYICAAGGAATDVAQAIFSKKGPGAPMTGNTFATAYDNNPLYGSPQPYPIAFEIPSPLQLLFSVTLVNSGQIPSNAVELVQNAVLGAVTQGVISPAAMFAGSVSGTVLTVSAVSFGSLAVGQTIEDTTRALADGTQITAFLSGSGGLGTYRVSVSQTVVSETMTASSANTQIIPNLRARIGQVLYGTTYVQAIAALGSWAQVSSIQVGSANNAAAVFIGSISGTTLTVASTTSGVVAVGQTLLDTTGVITPATTILASLGGGNWRVNNSQTVGGVTFTGSASNIGLVVSGVTGGPLAVGQTLTGTGIPGGTTITAQLSGTPGGAGTYLTSVATTASSSAITSSSGATFTGTASGLGIVATSVSGALTIGQIISGTGITAVTTLVEQLSGTPGGAGTYLVSQANTTAAATVTTSEAFTGVVANQPLVSIQANQIPQLVSGNIAVGVT